MANLAPGISMQVLNITVNETTSSVPSFHEPESTVIPTRKALSSTTDYWSPPTLQSCSKYKQESTDQPADEPMCTASGAILEHFTRFIGFHFDYHHCGDAAHIIEQSEMLYCSVLTTHNSCLPSPGGEKGELNMNEVPHFTAVKRAIEELCAANHTLSKTCLFEHLKYVTRCVEADVDSILNLRNEIWTYNALDTCRHLDVKIMCMWEQLQPCGAETAAFMTRQIGVQLRPEACPLSSAFIIQPHTYQVIVLFIIALALTYCMKD